MFENLTNLFSGGMGGALSGLSARINDPENQQRRLAAGLKMVQAGTEGQRGFPGGVFQGLLAPPQQGQMDPKILELLQGAAGGAGNQASWNMGTTTQQNMTPQQFLASLFGNKGNQG